jgi:hypothetical protein
VYETGDEQGAKPEPSSEHSKLDPVSVDVNSKLTVAFVVVAGGPFVIVVSGGVVSATWYVHEALAGLASVLPAASRARTWNWCGPGDTV